MNILKHNAATSAASMLFAFLERGRRRRFFALGGFLVLLAMVMLPALAPQNVSAQGGNPPNQPRRGLVYDGLTRSNRSECQNGYDVFLGNGKAPLCTHGPDPVPAPLEGTLSVPALELDAAAAVTCDGDGASGNRFQLLYVRAADMPDRFADYQASIQQWARDADGILNASAAATGGIRHFRYVHDANCIPIVQNVTVTASGDDSLSNIIMELFFQGFNRADRNYVIFADASVYCGIATIVSDDNPTASNSHNTGPYYSRVDARCWGGATIAHEMMHNLGGVQSSAPHATAYGHCTDEHDIMCYQDSGTTVLQYLCDISQSGLFDCNRDDYFNTNPAPGSYLATHWNTAESAFLIRQDAPTALRELFVDSLQTGKRNKQGQFVERDSFRRGETAQIRAHLLDDVGNNLPGVEVRIRVNRPDGTKQCSLRRATGADGFATRTCKIPDTAPTGQWQVVVTRLYKDGFATGWWSISTHPFTVKQKK
jgi:hypothetical protein